MLGITGKAWGSLYRVYLLNCFGIKGCASADALTGSSLPLLNTHYREPGYFHFLFV